MPTPASSARQALAGHTIWLWHYLHADWQWEQSRAWHAERYALAVGEALDLMQRDAEFMYFFDTESEFFSAVAERLGPRLEELRQRVREGRVRIVSAQVANCRPNQVGDETYLRNLQLGRAFFAANLPPTDLSLFHSVDIAIGHSQMPQILRLAGFQYYRAWRPHGPLNARSVPHQFHWEGLDGSRILVTRGPYGGLWHSKELPPLDDGHWDEIVSHLYDAYFHDQVLAGRSASGQLFLIQGSDDARPLRTGDGDRPIDVPGLLAAWRRREDIPIRWCTPLEFSRAVAAQAERLPVVRGMLDGADVGYNTANGGTRGLWYWRQMNDRRLLRAERWAAAAAAAGSPAPQEELRQLWRQHLTYQAHAQEFAFQEDFDELVGLARDVAWRAERIEREAQGALARAAGGGDHTVRYVFNPHPWPVEADVEIQAPCPLAGTMAIRAVDEHGLPLPQQTLDEFRHPRLTGSLTEARQLVRVTLPPLGYRRIALQEEAAPAPQGPAPAPEGTLNAAGLRLVYRDHALRSVQDVASGAAYAGADGATWPTLAFHVLDNATWLFAGPELRREFFVPERSAWVETGPLRWRHRAWGTLGPYRAQVDTVAGGRARECGVEVRLEGHWDEAPLTGFVTLLGDLAGEGKLTADIPFGVEPRDPEHDIYVHSVPQGRDLGIADMFERLRPGFFWARSWVDWSAAGHGVTWLSADGCYYWLKEPGRLGHILLRCVRLTPGTWEERCGEHLAGAGVHTFSYALHFHDGNWRDAGPERRSAELHLPPVVRGAEGVTPATLPAAHSFLALAGPAQLSACYWEGEHLLVRLYEREGMGGEATLTLDRAPQSAQAEDLLGQRADVPVQVQGQEVRVLLRPWQIVTLRLGV